MIPFVFFRVSVAKYSSIMYFGRGVRLILMGKFMYRKERAIFLLLIFKA